MPEELMEDIMYKLSQVAPPTYSGNFVMTESRVAPPFPASHVAAGLIMRGKDGGWCQASYKQKRSWLRVKSKATLKLIKDCKYIIQQYIFTDNSRREFRADVALTGPAAPPLHYEP